MSRTPLFAGSVLIALAAGCGGGESANSLPLPVEVRLAALSVEAEQGCGPAPPIRGPVLLVARDGTATFADATGRLEPREVDAALEPLGLSPVGYSSYAMPCRIDAAAPASAALCALRSLVEDRSPAVDTASVYVSSGVEGAPREVRVFLQDPQFELSLPLRGLPIPAEAAQLQAARETIQAGGVVKLLVDEEARWEECLDAMASVATRSNRSCLLVLAPDLALGLR